MLHLSRGNPKKVNEPSPPLLRLESTSTRHQAIHPSLPAVPFCASPIELRRLEPVGLALSILLRCLWRVIFAQLQETVHKRAYMSTSSISAIARNSYLSILQLLE